MKICRCNGCGAFYSLYQAQMFYCLCGTHISLDGTGNIIQSKIGTHMWPGFPYAPLDPTIVASGQAITDSDFDVDEDEEIKPKPQKKNPFYSRSKEWEMYD